MKRLTNQSLNSSPFLINSSPILLWIQFMDADSYFWKTKKRPLKTKPRTKPDSEINLSPYP